ncbi:Zn finger protein [Sulfolobus polyhedral virus 2]|uniref:Zn finger protein n=1 Tax=Sulfolobus polyhedral virus 2 TaxID=2493125 RepID=A0A3S8NFJ0_9VIRU|nr:zinc-finger domain protein [Sulfolobus polyhedral virus 2]AZI76014.1 Zn finger protein [Sulfolobus polyhedral virus 2]
MNVYETSYGKIITCEFKSQSGSGYHYTRAIITKYHIKLTCDCEGFAMKGKCRHTEILERLINNDE